MNKPRLTMLSNVQIEVINVFLNSFHEKTRFSTKLCTHSGLKILYNKDVKINIIFREPYWVYKEVF